MVCPCYPFDIIEEGKYGIGYETEEELIEIIQNINIYNFDKVLIKQQAEKFSVSSFEKQLLREIKGKY